LWCKNKIAEANPIPNLFLFFSNNKTDLLKNLSDVDEDAGIAKYFLASFLNVGKDLSFFQTVPTDRFTYH